MHHFGTHQEGPWAEIGRELYQLGRKDFCKEIGIQIFAIVSKGNNIDKDYGNRAAVAVTYICRCISYRSTYVDVALLGHGALSLMGLATPTEEADEPGPRPSGAVSLDRGSGLQGADGVPSPFRQRR